MHYIEFAFEYKMHKVGSPLSLYLENTKQDPQVVWKTKGDDTILGKRNGK